MKKFISIALSAVMLVSAGTVAAMPVMAAPVASPGHSEVTTRPASETEPTIVTVNSGKSTKTNYTRNGSQYTFKYNGGGKVTGWEFPGMTEGVDYKIISMSDDKTDVTIELTESGKQKQVKANALVTATEQVNGNENLEDIDKTTNSKNNTIKFVYTGKGEVTDWEFPGLIEGVDYEVINQSEDNKTITIKLLGNTRADDVTANAIVEKADTTDKKDDSEDDSKSDSAKKDNSGTSPATGAAMAGIAMAGAGVAMLAISKKKKD